MIYFNFYWHLKRVFDLFSVQYEVRSLTTFLETGRFGRTTFIFGAFPRNIAFDKRTRPVRTQFINSITLYG